MLIMLHVICAVTSLATTAFAVVWPSRNGYRAGLTLTALTVLSGGTLIAQDRSHWLSVCTSGVTFLAFALSGLTVSRWRLAREQITIRK